MSNTNVAVIDPNRGNTQYTFQEPIPVQSQGGLNTGGAIPYSYIATGANTDAVQVTNTQTTLFGQASFNLVNTIGYLKVYDSATLPTNASTPKLRIPVPATSGNTGAVESPPFPPQGVVFANGLAFRLTQNLTDGDNTNVSANSLVVNLFYQN